ncbi:MAG: hypothetical protein RIE32_09370 [Phycisphaerales bacterium]
MPPHEPIIRWIALGLLALGLLWFLAAAIGLRPRAVRVRRAIRRSGSGTMLCGACGHPAVSLGTIESCPECGCSYAAVGLDGRTSGSRWAPPVLVVGLVLLGSWALGSVSLAPSAARWANERTIGSAELERWQSRAGFVADLLDPATGATPGLTIELERDLIGPATVPHGHTRRRPIEGRFTITLSHGPDASNARTVWRNDPIVRSSPMTPYDLYRMPGSATSARASPVAIPDAGALPSPWAGIRSRTPSLELSWTSGDDWWVLRDDNAASVERGKDIEMGVRALISASGISGTEDPPPFWSVRIYSSVLEIARDAGSVPFETRSPRGPGRTSFDGLAFTSEIVATPSRTPYHPAAPWGLAAAIGASAALLLVAVLVLFLSWRTRRLPARGAI